MLVTVVHYLTQLEHQNPSEKPFAHHFSRMFDTLNTLFQMPVHPSTIRYHAKSFVPLGAPDACTIRCTRHGAVDKSRAHSLATSRRIGHSQNSGRNPGEIKTASLGAFAFRLNARFGRAVVKGVVRQVARGLSTQARECLSRFFLPNGSIPTHL